MAEYYRGAQSSQPLNLRTANPVGAALEGYKGVDSIIKDNEDRKIAALDREAAITRQGKQDVVRRLDELGAFNLRKAVEDIADRLEVSRFTIYNYLNAHD